LARGLARDVAASIEHRWGDRVVAKRLAAEALAHYRLVGYREGEASALHLSGRIALADGDHRRATRQLGRALRVYRRIGHRAGVAAALTSLADVAELSAAEQAGHAGSGPRAEAGAPVGSDAPAALAEVAERIHPTAARLRADAAAVLADIGLS
jgi:rhodanese-related sulfurtransferase